MWLSIIRFCLVFLFLGAIFVNFSVVAANDVLPILLNEQARWTFASQHSLEKVPVSVNTDLGAALPIKYPCCDGYYEMNYIFSGIEKAYFEAHREISYGILLNPVAQLQYIELNQKKLPLEKFYPSSMILLPVSKSDLESGVVKLKIGVAGPRLFHSGMWLGFDTHFDNLQNLLRRKQTIEFHQIITPFIMCIFFVLLILILFWIKFEGNLKNEKIFNAFIANLVSWLLFYAFLSGYMRSISEFWGSLLHLPVRAVAGITTFRLVALIGEIDVKKINFYSKLLVVPILIHLSLIQTKFRYVAILILSIYYFIMVFPVLVFFKKVKKTSSFFEIYFFASAALAAIGYLNDGIRLCAMSLGYSYPVPYLNRYSTAPFLFGTLIYLVNDLIFLTRKNAIRASLEDAAAQFSHDIRSPLQALQIASRSIESADPELKELVVFSTQRIKEISDSLAHLQERSLVRAIDVDNILGDLEKLIKEKTRLQTNAVDFKLNKYSEKSATVLANRAELNRVFSNLLNNGIEAIGTAGEIEISLAAESSFLVFVFKDTGCGISKSVLEALGKRGKTFGKEGGSGLGLFSAKENIKSWGGFLLIDSELGVGTRVKVGLLRA